MQLAKNPHIYCPFNPFITKSRYKDEIDSGIIEIIGEAGGVSYYVLNSFSSIEGLGDFNYSTSSGSASANSGFLGCATKEIAQHFGKYHRSEVC